MALHASHLNNLHANRPGGNEQGTLYSIECLHGVREGEGHHSLFTFPSLHFANTDCGCVCGKSVELCYYSVSLYLALLPSRLLAAGVEEAVDGRVHVPVGCDQS